MSASAANCKADCFKRPLSNTSRRVIRRTVSAIQDPRPDVMRILAILLRCSRRVLVLWSRINTSGVSPLPMCRNRTLEAVNKKLLDSVATVWFHRDHTPQVKPRSLTDRLSAALSRG